ncbi:MAG: Phosphoglycerate kinase [Candidatus Magasanikbacteria bacterium GW2011_GWC2_37_14]|uniref:Phosphoglycerate kinase n=1 Tax=Candidatus Magasanikbacteria bacterium GW2011_GWC2_37_14 TaxID=1619046 RepID=A0A0G0IUJ9_9BACT|nr:MAG: Phosphoglycerate kinase [Candidatus Magasanikbacteria bacterium GW2011_GWC2_37_14]
MKLRTLKQIKNLKNKRVLVRVDFNVPVNNGKILDDERIKLSVPTIEYLLKKKAKVILLTHLGRPAGYNGKGKSGYDKKFALTSVVKKASELLNKEIKFVEDIKIGRAKDQELYFANAEKEIAKMKDGEIVMLENMRFFPEEAKEITKLSKKIAKLGDIFVLDGFAVAHREAASVSGVAKYLPSFAGFLLEKEIINLNKVTEKPKSPFVVVLGGAKVETKAPVLKNLLPKADYVLIGGGVFNTYLKAVGYKLGGSLVDNDYLKDSLKYCKTMKVIKPIDVVVGTEDGKHYEVLKVNSKLEIKNSKLAILDIGPATIRLYAEYIKKAKTLVWNGAMGYFEKRVYSTGTLSVARLVASRARGRAFGVIGGGETLEAMERVKMTEFVDLVSTGGGAMLEYLAGKKLPGIRALIS